MKNFDTKTFYGERLDEAIKKNTWLAQEHKIAAFETVMSVCNLKSSFYLTNCTSSTFHLTFILLYLYKCSYLIISVIFSVDDKVYT